MANITLTVPRVSALRSVEVGLAADGVNDGCHGNTAGVQPNDKAILAHVRVFLICWGRFYDDHPDALDNAFKLCGDVVAGSYFNGLAQYGVGRGSVVGSARTLVPDAPKTLNEDQARDQVKEFARNLGEAPAVDENSLLYVIFLPVETTPTISTGQDDFCGYHTSTKFNDSSRNDDLFYAIIRTDKVDKSSGAALVQNVSYCVSHEIAEAVTNRDGRGYHNPSCEIGDLCEQNDTFDYRSWQVEQYWSEWDRSCINGDKPVSLRRFLQAKGQTGGSLRALGTPTIDTEYVASQFR